MKDFIMYPLIGFLAFVFLPLWPTVWIVWTGASLIWLVLTLGWGAAWFLGMFVWREEREKNRRGDEENAKELSL